jgi:hypothetical protein
MSSDEMGKMTFRNVATDTIMNGAGGVVSAALTAGARLTKSTWDDDPLTQIAAKGAVGLGLKWLFRNRRGVHEFVAGMNGHSAGDAADKWVLKKLTA